MYRAVHYMASGPGHRGRLQVQGKDMAKERSRPWAQETARLAQTAQQDLTDLQQEITETELSLRELAFEKAKHFIEACRAKGGVAAPVAQSFKNPGLPKKHRTARVDVDVKTGAAFV